MPRALSQQLPIAPSMEHHRVFIALFFESDFKLKINTGERDRVSQANLNMIKRKTRFFLPVCDYEK